MAHLISATTRLQAWIQGTQYLLDEAEAHTTLNLILDIAEPGSDGPHATEARALIDAFLAQQGEAPIHTVAETIFPGWAYQRRGFKGMEAAYRKEYAAIKAGNPQSWGTYADRLLTRSSSTETINPLEEQIKKMATQAVRAGGTNVACYESDVTEGPYDIKLYDTSKDRTRHRGQPCLSHLSFKLYGGKVHLTATYRSHCYLFKVFGNLLGLARLQACFANEVNLEVARRDTDGDHDDLQIGGLVVHSTYAFAHKARRATRQLLRDLNAQLQET